MELAVDFEGVIEAGRTSFVASMDDDIEAVLPGELEMATQKIALSGMVVFIGPSFWGGMEIIEAGLSEGCDLGVIEVGAEERFEVIARLMHITGMNTEAGVDFGVGPGQLKIC